MRKDNAFSRDLGRNAANFAPLTPLSFIERAAGVYPDRLAVVHGRQRFTWKRGRRAGSEHPRERRRYITKADGIGDPAR